MVWLKGLFILLYFILSPSACLLFTMCWPVWLLSPVESKVNWETRLGILTTKPIWLALETLFRSFTCSDPCRGYVRMAAVLSSWAVTVGDCCVSSEWMKSLYCCWRVALCSSEAERQSHVSGLVLAKHSWLLMRCPLYFLLSSPRSSCGVCLVHFLVV